MDKKFWISQACAIAATIIGVYLAATTGFQLAIDFENGKSRKDTFYVARSLYGEAKQNTDNMSAWAEKFRSSPKEAFKMKQRKEDYTLNTFVWETMKRSPSSFELPFEYLGKIQNYYLFADKQMEKMMASPMSSSLGDALIAKTKELQETLDAFGAHVEKEEKAVLALGFEL